MRRYVRGGTGGRIMPTKPTIGPIRLEHPVVMAPMAGVTDLPYRLIAREMGAALVYSELVSAKGICYGNERSLKLLETDEAERPVGLQIFGGEADVMVQAALHVQEGRPDLLDINMGCPVPKITRNDEGCALMLDPKRAGRLVAQVVEAVNIPVTVKIRKGWDDQRITAPAVARELERAGVAAIAIHGRTREQFYTGQADWDIIREVKQAVDIPVIGNGDVASPQDAARMLEETGCDAVMIGRACLGDPWIFRRVVHYLDTGELLPLPSPRERLEMAMRHLRMAVDFKGEYRAVREMRKPLAWYLKGIPGANRMKQRVQREERAETMVQMLADFLASLGDVADEPLPDPKSPDRTRAA